ncbi:MAG: hypothetical protein ABSA92_10520 [Candidatus Bathyarchaeia archaeon]
MSDFVAHAVTSPSLQHFFGYYGQEPWDITGLTCSDQIGHVDPRRRQIRPAMHYRLWNCLTL